MRTSKKGGRGGSWSVQMAGEAGAPALIPPVTRYSASTSTRSVGQQVLRGFGWFLIVVLVISAGIAGGLYLYGHESLQSINGNQGGSKGLGNTKGLLHLAPPGKAAVALIAGYDHRAGDGGNGYAGSNSDTLMLLRADPKTNTLSLLSFPRDLNVPIYCNGNTIWGSDRINSAWAHCSDGGPRGALDTISHLTGVPINYLITLDFNAFVQVVHRIQGVYMNV